jgi:hypothetical protein
MLGMRADPSEEATKQRQEEAMYDHPTWITDRLNEIKKRGDSIMSEKKDRFRSIDIHLSEIASLRHELRVQGIDDFNNRVPLDDKEEITLALYTDKIARCEAEIAKLRTEIEQIDVRGREVLQIAARARAFVAALPETATITRIDRKPIDQLTLDDPPDVSLGVHVDESLKARPSMAQLFARCPAPPASVPPLPIRTSSRSA